MLVRTVLWQRLDVPGAEHFRLWQGADGPRLAGTVLIAHDRVPVQVEYEITCSHAWETRSLRVVVSRGATARRMEIVVDDHHHWWRDGEELGAVAGCLDVDLSVTPATNTLPIRRMDLGVGGAREVTAAWVRFPELFIEPLAQRYTRIAERQFHYESRGGAFATELEVDDLGLVIRYPPAWDRVAVFSTDRS